MGKPNGIFLNLSPEVIEMIDDRCGGPSYRPGEKRPGRSGGRAAWVRRLIHRELGLKPPPDPHQEKSLEFEAKLAASKQRPNNRVTPLDWARTVERVLELRGQGMSLREIAQTLEHEEVPTKRGGKWSAQTVRNILLEQAGATT